MELPLPSYYIKLISKELQTRQKLTKQTKTIYHINCNIWYILWDFINLLSSVPISKR